jgi:hypothetical protein
MMEIIAALASLLKLLNMFGEMTRERKDEGAGYAQAVKDMLDQAHKDLAWADAERVLIAESHANDPSDNSFSSEFRRPA